mmetsp:Transcript_85410/g.265731  ORF Transcript_85410/g.265731 Transcript_85410/m.265731 type:complete len:439 (-) Transcript_85410:53-1369(-)
MPGLLHGNAPEIGQQELQHCDVAHDQHRPGAHLNLCEQALQPLHDIHVALAPWEAAPQRRLLEPVPELWVPSLHLLPRWHVGPTLHVPPSLTNRTLVQGVEGRSLFLVRRGIASRRHGAGHGAGDDSRRLLLLAHGLPEVRCTVAHKACKGHREAAARAREAQEPAPGVRGRLRVGLPGTSPDQPDGPGADVHAHEIGQDTPCDPAVAMIHQHLGGEVVEFDVRALIISHRFVDLLVLGNASLEVHQCLLVLPVLEVRAVLDLVEHVGLHDVAVVADDLHEEYAVLPLVPGETLADVPASGGHTVGRVKDGDLPAVIQKSQHVCQRRGGRRLTCSVRRAVARIKELAPAGLLGSCAVTSVLSDVEHLCPQALPLQEPFQLPGNEGLAAGRQAHHDQDNARSIRRKSLTQGLPLRSAGLLRHFSRPSVVRICAAVWRSR